MSIKVEHPIVTKIFEMQDANGCWNVLNESDRYFSTYNYYEPIYKSTLWTLILLADLKIDPHDIRVQNPLKIITEYFWDQQTGIFNIGKSHFPIPCLNGNMIYLHSYFQSGNDEIIDTIIDFFSTYQRFDDGDYQTPSLFPYHSNKSCYGKHSCYWGVVKLFKGLSFIPLEKRSNKCKVLMQHCIDFILLHEVCYSSHNKSTFLHTNIKYLTFPNMYQSDFLEILWLLKREHIQSESLVRALQLLESKRSSNSTWKLERNIKNLTVPITRKSFGNEFITERAQEVDRFFKNDD